MMEAIEPAIDMAAQTTGGEGLKAEVLSLSAYSTRLARLRRGREQLEKRFAAAAVAFDLAKPGSDLQLEKLAELEELEIEAAQIEQQLLAALSGVGAMLIGPAPRS